MRIPAYLTLPVLLLPMIGCQSSTDDRLVQLAQEHAARQAESQRQMTDLQKQVAEGSKRLVEADAQARQELTALQRELQSTQAEIHRGHDQLEVDRRAIAADRNRDQITAAIVLDVGIVLACLLPLTLGIYVLWSARRAGESDSAVAELLVQELVATEPTLLLPNRPSFPRLAPAADPRSGSDPAECDQPAG